MLNIWLLLIINRWIMPWNKAVFCLEVVIFKYLQIWRHNYVISCNEYLISTLLESTFPWVYSLQFLFKSTHNSWSYKSKSVWVFFSEHSVLHWETSFHCDWQTSLYFTLSDPLVLQLGDWHRFPDAYPLLLSAILHYASTCMALSNVTNVPIRTRSHNINRVILCMKKS